MTCCNPEITVAARNYPPGLSALVERRSTYAQFLQRMVDQISLQKEQQADPTQPNLTPLAALTTRQTQDPTIAFLDAWAIVLDVLDFYQQRWLNENYLRTATQTLSIMELAGEIGYELKPGLAATTWLAFTIDPNQGTATVPQGTQVQSLPTQSNPPQAFETLQDLAASVQFNTLIPDQPLQKQTQPVSQSYSQINLQGVNTNLKVGDGILIIDNVDVQKTKQAYFATVTSVVTDLADGLTTISWQWQTSDSVKAMTDPAIFALRTQLSCFGSNGPSFQSVQSVYPKTQHWDPYITEVAGVTGSESNADPGITIWQCFDAQGGGSYINYSKNFYADLFLNQINSKILPSSYVILLSRQLVRLRPRLPNPPRPGRYEYEIVYQILSISDVNNQSLQGFGLSGTVTGLKIYQQWNESNGGWQSFSDLDKTSPGGFDFGFRDTIIYAQSERLPLYYQSLPKPGFIQSQNITLNKVIDGFVPGQTLAISSINNNSPQTESITIQKVAYDTNSQKVTLTLAEPLNFFYQPGTIDIYNSPSNMYSVDIDDPSNPTSTLSFLSSVAPSSPLTVGSDLNLLFTLQGTIATYSEVFTITGSYDNQGNTVLTLSQDLQYAYPPANCILYGNVVEASNGATVAQEVLGSGDGTQINQSFTLKRQPLTYLPAPTAQGSQDTLQISVNNVYWQEVPSFYGQGPTSKCYVVNTDKDGVTQILFGDGQQGARLPTGQENVIATYRIGLGSAGQVGIGSLTLMQTRPLGVKSVTNPLPATGAADPETEDDARQNAIWPVLTLGRVVSLVDMEYFTLGYPGISKVQAALLPRLQQPPVFYLTVCGANGAAIEDSSLLQQNLLQAINEIRTPGQALIIASYDSQPFSIEAWLVINPSYVASDVLNQVNTELLNQFGFSASNLAQPVRASEIIEVIQAIQGVIAVNITKLYLNSDITTADSFPSQAELLATPAQEINGTLQPAQLLMIDPNGIALFQQ